MEKYEITKSVLTKVGYPLESDIHNKLESIKTVDDAIQFKELMLDKESDVFSYLTGIDKKYYRPLVRGSKSVYNSLSEEQKELSDWFFDYSEFNQKDNSHFIMWYDDSRFNLEQLYDIDEWSNEQLAKHIINNIDGERQLSPDIHELGDKFVYNTFILKELERRGVTLRELLAIYKNILNSYYQDKDDMLFMLKSKFKTLATLLKNYNVHLKTDSSLKIEDCGECDIDNKNLSEFRTRYLSNLNEGLLEEAEYKGKKVNLRKPFRTPGGPKKYSVYVKNGKGNVVKVNFGDPNMKIKRDKIKNRKSFRARHNCSSKKDPTTPGYWSCKFWSNKSVSSLLKKSK